jgi:hypothetical protein
MKKSIILIFIGIFGFIPSAQAYIDPGSGSFIVQMLIASLLGATFTLKMYFKNLKQKILHLFSSQKDQNNKDENAPNSDDSKKEI